MVEQAAFSVVADLRGFLGTMLDSGCICPMDMKKIDDALAAGPALSAEQLAEVKQLRADGETLHNAGKHQESVDTLAKAMAILGIDQG